MFLTPGIDFLVRSSADYLFTCGIIYVTLISLKQLLKPTLYIPDWVPIFSSLVLRVGYMVAQPWIKEVKNSKAARAHGAVLPPHVKENHIRLAKSLTQEPNVGYPRTSLFSYPPSLIVNI
jgi:hypothetical protein